MNEIVKMIRDPDETPICDYNRTAIVLGDPEVTANLYCNFAFLYWKICVICSIYLR